jgi:hypothetical protein
MAKGKIWHVTSRNAWNDITDMWTADEAKAREEFSRCLDRNDMNLVEDGISLDFFCYVDRWEVYTDPNGLSEFNKAHGTDCKDWKEAAMVAGAFTGECNCASSEAKMEAFGGEVLGNGKAVVYNLVELDKRVH